MSQCNVAMSGSPIMASSPPCYIHDPGGISLIVACPLQIPPNESSTHPGMVVQTMAECGGGGVDC